MSEQNLPSFVRYLLRSDSYPHSADEMRLIQTHISFVVIAGSYVYKWKKPVNFGFLDFSTLEKRKFFSERELVLNRRLCPDIYLDTVSLTCQGGQFELNGAGEAVEFGVKMARMPEDRMMPAILQSGNLKREHLDAIIDVLVPFYSSAEGGPQIREFGRAEAVAVNVMENFDQTESFIGKGALSRQMFDGIKAYARGVLADVSRFERRMAGGKIRDCHGDLYSANICLDEKVHIFDCIEFNERFRYSDVAADIAFLAMDLDFHGLNELSAYFIKRFSAASGDEGVGDLLDFYKCYRAYVRGKIGLFTANDPSVDAETSRRCTEQACRYFQLAAVYAGQDV